MKKFLPVSFGIGLSLILTSCSVLNNGKPRQFSYYDNEKPQRLVFKLPDGRSEELFRVGNDNAKEQFYYFGDGAVFYIARNTSWQTVNQHRIGAMIGDASKPHRIYNGKDGDGLHWKEIAFDDFKIGYAYVTNDRVELFDRALNSIRIK